MLEKHKIRKAALLVMKKILLLTTGGTIASSDTGSGLMPVAGADRLLNYVPDINKICNLYENNTYFILLFEVFISK